MCTVPLRVCVCVCTVASASSKTAATVSRDASRCSKSPPANPSPASPQHEGRKFPTTWVVNSHAVSTQQLSLGSSNFQACFQARLLEQATRRPGKAGLIADSVASTRLRGDSPQARRRLDTLHIECSILRTKPQRPLAVKITNLVRTSPPALPNSSFPGPTGRALRRIGATSPLALPCEPARCPALWQP